MVKKLLVLRSPNELGQLSQRLSHGDRTANILLSISILVLSSSTQPSRARKYQYTNTNTQYN